MIEYNKYLETDLCDKIVSKFEELNKSDFVSIRNNDDIRIFGFEKILDKDVVDYIFEIDKKASIKFFNKKPNYQTIMINKTFKPLNYKGLGSGGGWHRDSYFKKQMKTIFYLSSVDLNNGPFCYLEPKNELFSRYYPISKRLGENADKKLEFCTNKKYITAKKKGFGFSIVSNFIHRGLPVKKGVRYALTVYSSLNDKIKFIDNLKIKL
jgi:hypothetical protein